MQEEINLNDVLIPANYNLNAENKNEMLNFAVDKFSKENNSVISDNFFGFTESKFYCGGCRKTTYNYQYYNFIEVPAERICEFNALRKKSTIIHNLDNMYITNKNNLNQLYGRQINQVEITQIMEMNKWIKNMKNMAETNNIKISHHLNLTDFFDMKLLAKSGDINNMMYCSICRKEII